jgi:uncharacterized protein YeaO (DUF488 family)
MKVQIKRIYEPAKRSDGMRVLVDRIWPRGVRKEDADIAFWLKDIAPSTELRVWFGHDPKRWSVFRTKYRKELAHNDEAVGELLTIAGGKPLTLVYAAHDTKHNHAIVLAEFLAKRPKPAASRTRARKV